MMIKDTTTSFTFRSYFIHHLMTSPFIFFFIQSMFPAIVDEQERLSYKREFERDHQEYKSLQAELDDINLGLADLDKELNRHPEGSPQFLVSALGWQQEDGPIDEI